MCKNYIKSLLFNTRNRRLNWKSVEKCIRRFKCIYAHYEWSLEYLTYAEIFWKNVRPLPIRVIIFKFLISKTRTYFLILHVSITWVKNRFTYIDQFRYIIINLIDHNFGFISYFSALVSSITNKIRRDRNYQN